MNSIARFSSRLVLASHPYDTAETSGSTPAHARYHAALPAALAQLPVAANQAPPGEATDTIGAMHGCGSFTLALMSAFPLALARNKPVLTLVTVAIAPVMVWQLTMASK